MMGYGLPQGNGPMTPDPIQTPPANDPEEERKEKMRRRLFWLLFAVSVILLALVVWEIVDCFVGY